MTITDYIIGKKHIYLELESINAEHFIISIPIINFRDVAISVLEEERKDED